MSWNNTHNNRYAYHVFRHSGMVLLAINLFVRLYFRRSLKYTPNGVKIFLGVSCIIICFNINSILTQIIESMGWVGCVERDKPITIYSGRAEWESDTYCTTIGYWCMLLGITLGYWFYLFLTDNEIEIDKQRDKQREHLSTLWITIGATVTLWSGEILWNYIYQIFSSIPFFLRIASLILTLVELIIAKCFYCLSRSLVKYKKIKRWIITVEIQSITYKMAHKEWLEYIIVEAKTSNEAKNFLIEHMDGKKDVGGVKDYILLEVRLSNNLDFNFNFERLITGIPFDLLPKGTHSVLGSIYNGFKFGY